MPTTPIQKQQKTIEKPKEKQKTDLSTYATIGFIIFLMGLLIGLGMYSGGIEQRLSDAEWELSKATNNHNETIRLLENASKELIQKTMELQILMHNHTALETEYNKKLKEINDLNTLIDQLNKQIEDLTQEME